MFKKPIKEINAEYQAEEKYLPSIQSLIRETCINANLPRKDVAAVTLAIEEGVTNIIRHAYLYEKGLVRIRVVIFRRRIVFSLIDTGRSFQPDGDSKLDLKKMIESGRKGGLGFYMINKIMDSVEYISAPGFNELRMTKLISRQSEKTRAFMGRMFTLRVKFSLYTFAIMLTIIAGSYLFINSRSVKRIYEHLHDTVAALSKTVAAQASGYILNRRSDVEFDDLAFSYLKANQDLTMLVITDTAGLILADSRDIKNLHKKYKPPEGINASSIARPQEFIEKGDKLNYMIFYVRSGDRIIGQVHTAYTNKSYMRQINSERRKVILLTLIGLAIGIGGIYILSSYFVSPIVRITERVRKFSSGDFETELPLEDVEEYFEISKALNEMMSRLRRDRENIIERERVAKEIEVAGQIQQTLLPRKLPEIPGLKLDAFYRAASRISGDLYDVFSIDGRNYCLLVADVSGKGIPASLMMSVLRTVVRIQARGKLSSHQIMTDVNLYLKEDIPPGIFITILLAIYDSETGRMNFVSAGHNPLLCLRAKAKEPELHNPPGIPLGLPLDDDKAFAVKLIEKTIELNSGDRLFIYTDGITESMDRSGQKYGLDRLLALFGNEVSPETCFDPKKITELVLADIDRHAGIAIQNDDITFIVACRSGEGEHPEIKGGPDSETIA
jgi:serine phosphatase RsbU (regulator of sigma subunit)/anti-sigma regulatory factor (Ser/Thr protein kinase)